MGGLVPLAGRIAFILVMTVAGTSVPTANGWAQKEAPADFELMHLWLADTEAPALDYLKQVVEAAGLNWSEQRIKGNFLGVRSALARRIALTVPPQAAFWIGGDELNTLIDTNIIRSIPLHATENDLRKILKPEVAQIIAHKNQFSSLPLVIHLQNVAVLRKDIYEKLDLDTPKSWSEFIAQASVLKSAGYVPLTVSDEGWQLRFLFASIMSDQLTADEFRDLLLVHREDVWSVAQLTRSFKTLLALRQFANPDSRDLQWQDALFKVRDGNSAMTITGDFAAPALKGHDNIVCTLAPGNSFVSWSFDVLAFPVMSQQSKSLGQDIAIRAMSSQTFLETFALRKGGVSVAKSVAAASSDACSASSARNWDERPKLHFNAERWRLHLNFVATFAQAFWRATDPDPATYAAALMKELKSLADR